MTALADPQIRIPRETIGPPPIPHEHGAWMMLYLPLMVALFVFHPVPLGPAVLLIFSVTSAFFAQNAAGLALRRRTGPRIRFWLAAYSLILATSSGILLFLYGRIELIWIGLPAFLLFGWQLWLRQKARKRLNHARLSEIAAVAVFALTVPALHIAARGELAPPAWWLWGACVLFFSSSVFYVRMLVDAARRREGLSLTARWQVGRELLLYHTLLTVILVALFFQIETAWSVALAYAPVLLRALWGWVRLSDHLPSLKRVGIGEILYSFWFAAWLVAALRGIPGFAG